MKEEQQYKCEKCKEKFTESQIVKEKVSGSNCCDYDVKKHCPKCGSQYFIFCD